MSLVNVINDALTISFPRVSGDEPFKAFHLEGARQFSPRERG